MTQAQTNQMTLWEIDPAHSSANFSIRHMMIAKVHGGFTKLSGQLRLDRNNPSHSEVEEGEVDLRLCQPKFPPPADR